MIAVVVLTGIFAFASRSFETQFLPLRSQNQQRIDPAQGRRRVSGSEISNIRQITRSHGYHSPKWSPRGDALSFVDDSATYVAKLPSLEVHRISAEPARFGYFWTSDARSLVYRTTDANGSFQIRKMSVDSGAVKPIATGSDLTLPVETETGSIEYRGSEGVQATAVSSNDRDSGTFAWQYGDQIFVIYSGSVRQVTMPDSGRYFLPVVSPNKSYLLYYELSRGLFVMNLQTGSTRTLGVLSDASWSHEGHKILAVRITYKDEIPIASELLLIANDGSISAVAGVPDRLLPMRPVWSPDDRHIAFDADGAIYVADMKE
jgi:Tol biopolymer transport system component